MPIVVVSSVTVPASNEKFAKYVLRKLGRIDQDETVDSSDQDLVDDMYASVYEELRARHLVDWGNSDAVPVWAISHLTDLVANRVANSYGLPRNTQEEDLAIQKMAKHLAADYLYEPIEAEYY